MIFDAKFNAFGFVFNLELSLSLFFKVMTLIDSFLDTKCLNYLDQGSIL